MRRAGRKKCDVVVFSWVSAGSLAASSVGVPFIARAQAPLNVDRAKLTKTMRFMSYGGSWQEALTTAAIKPFEDKYGVKVLQESYDSEAELIAKMKAAGPGEYDVVTVERVRPVPGRQTGRLRASSA